MCMHAECLCLAGPSIRFVRSLDLLLCTSQSYHSLSVCVCVCMFDGVLIACIVVATRKKKKRQQRPSAGDIRGEYIGFLVQFKIRHNVWLLLWCLDGFRECVFFAFHNSVYLKQDLLQLHQAQRVREEERIQTRSDDARRRDGRLLGKFTFEHVWVC